MAAKKVENLETNEKKVVSTTKTTSKTTKKPSEKAPTTKKPTTTKSTSTTKKSTTTTKTPSKKVTKTPAKKKIDPKTGKVIVEKPVVKTEPKTPKKTAVTPVTPEVKPKKKPSKPRVPSKELTIEPPERKEKVIVRPTPKKVKELTKEEKAIYKNVSENFSFILNMGQVIEDRTMDREQIKDLTIGEIHVIETVNKYNNKPMSLIARKEHVTVGALTICVNRLVQKNYLERRRDEMDHRIILLNVTQKAKKVLKEHDKFHENVLGLILEKTSLNEVNKVLNQVAYYLEAYYDPSILEEKVETKKKKK